MCDLDRFSKIQSQIIFKTISESGVPVTDTGVLQWFQLKSSLELAHPKFIDESSYRCKMKNFIL